MKDITIAIDGHAGCGKSSTAKEVAKRLGYLYIDSGAMYRAVSLHFLRHNIPFEKETPELIEELENIYIDFFSLFRFISLSAWHAPKYNVPSGSFGFHIAKECPSPLF